MAERFMRIVELSNGKKVYLGSGVEHDVPWFSFNQEEAHEIVMKLTEQFGKFWINTKA